MEVYTGLEAETVVGMKGGVDTEAGMDSELTADPIGAGAGAGTKASTRCTIATGGGDAGADLRSTVAGTVTGDNVAAVAKVQVGPIAEMIPLECAAAANARLRITGAEMERVG